MRIENALCLILVVPSAPFQFQTIPSITSSSTKLFEKIDKGFNLLGQRFIPQGPIVATVKGGWRFVWQRMMAELAPQDNSGKYKRPKYDFENTIEPGQDLHLYLGEACPWCHR
jgi:hypothetical protein